MFSKKREDQGSTEVLKRRVRELETALATSSDGLLHERIRELEELVDKLSSEDAKSKAIGRLRTALQLAKEKLAEQDAMLKQLTTHPLPYATVVALGYDLFQPTSSVWADFKVNSRVQVIKSYHSPYIGETGKIEAVETGEALVKLDLGGRDWFLTGHPQVSNSECHLRLLSRGDDLWKPVDPSLFVEGASVITRNGQIGIVTNNWDGGYVYVNLDDNDDGAYYRVGRPGNPAEEQQIRLYAPEIESTSDEEQSSTAIIVFDGKPLEVTYPRDLVVRPGDTVKVTPQTMQILEVVGTLRSGELALVTRLIDDKTCEVEYSSARRVVFLGNISKDDLEIGHRVILDASLMVVVENIGRDKEKHTLSHSTNVEWDDIGGLEEAKREMIEAIELPHRESYLYRSYGKKPVKGVLLYGPPGCGKTMLAKAAATAMSRIHGNGEDIPSGFLYLKGPEILTRWVGESESAIREIFARARKHKEEHGYPAVIFIDEAESILRKRGTGISSDMESTIVPMFLAEMDGLDETGALVLLATNRSDILDPAVVRDGRIDRKVRIDRPTRESATTIFELALQNVPLNNGFTRRELAEFAVEQLFSDDLRLYELRVSEAEEKHMTLADILNGGMIVSIVDQASSLAIGRDMESGEISGVGRDDIAFAVQKVFRQNLDLNHEDEVEEFVRGQNDRILGIRKLRQAAA